MAYNTSLARFTVLGMIAIWASGCGGGSGSGGGGTQPPPPPPPPPFGANFSEIQSNVFTPTCATAGCHAGAGAQQGLRLEESVSYAMLVNVPSTENNAVLRVAPNDPDNSYLIQKLEGTASVGAQMPLNGTPLDQAAIDVIRQWVIDGAIDDRAPSADPIRVTALTPVPGSDDVAPAEISATFDRELDVSTVNANTFLLRGSGGDRTFGDGNEVDIVANAITTPAMTPMSATFDLTGINLGDDSYQVRLLGSGASMIMDIDANALDGEFSGAFPSGDGTAGGDFEATFTVTTVPAGVTFDEIQANVFTPSCATTGCHAGGTPAGGLNLQAGQAFGSLVSIASSNPNCAALRVSPGDPNNSCLIERLEGTVAPQMPFGGPALAQSDIDDIRQWITDGANP